MDSTPIHLTRHMHSSSPATDHAHQHAYSVPQMKMGDCIYPYTIQALIYCVLDLSSNNMKQIVTMLKDTNTGDRVQNIDLVIAGFLSPDDPSAFALVALVKKNT